MDVSRNIIPIVEDDQGEGIYDPLEESEIVQSLKGLTRAEARRLAKQHKIPWKEVQKYRNSK
jgi:hypothetical protein